MFLSFFFFFREKIDVPGYVKLKLKNEMTLILEFFREKKKNQSWQDGHSHLLYSILA